MQVNETKEVLSVSETAVFLGVGRDRVRALVTAGELPAVKLGPRSTRIPVSALREWLARRSEGTTETTE